MICAIQGSLYKVESLRAQLKCAKEAIQREDYRLARKYLDMAKLEATLIEKELRNA